MFYLRTISWGQLEEIGRAIGFFYFLFFLIAELIDFMCGAGGFLYDEHHVCGSTWKCWRCHGRLNNLWLQLWTAACRVWTLSCEMWDGKVSFLDVSVGVHVIIRVWCSVKNVQEQKPHWFHYFCSIMFPVDCVFRLYNHCCWFISELTRILLETRVVAEAATRSSGGNVEPGKWIEIQVPVVAFWKLMHIWQDVKFVCKLRDSRLQMLVWVFVVGDWWSSDCDR